jgi:putative ABC transport system substrate-binding protein
MWRIRLRQAADCSKLGRGRNRVTARAQQPAMPVVGFLRSTTAAGGAHLVTAFRQGLSEVGLVEGWNVAIEYRCADDHHDR